jgi:hypothetical protein
MDKDLKHGATGVEPIVFNPPLLIPAFLPAISKPRCPKNLPQFMPQGVTRSGCLAKGVVLMVAGSIGSFFGQAFLVQENNPGI